MTADKKTNHDIPSMEAALKTALRREEPSVGFTEDVLARVTQLESTSTPPRDLWSAIFRKPLVRWAAFATVSASLVVGGIHYRSAQRERASGEAAKQQLMLALRIAGSKLQLARARVNEINAPRSENPKKNEEIKD